MGAISFWYFWTIWARKKLKNLILKKERFQGWLKFAQFLQTEFLGLPTWDSIISDISPSILEVLVSILLHISWIFHSTPNMINLDDFEGSYGRKSTKIENQKICQFEPINAEIQPFFRMRFFSFFLAHSVGAAKNETLVFQNTPNLQSLHDF